MREIRVNGYNLRRFKMGAVKKRPAERGGWIKSSQARPSTSTTSRDLGDAGIHTRAGG
jgi:hypothetical protein